MIDHVNRVIRGFETVGAVAKIKGEESLQRDVGDALKFIYGSSKRRIPGTFGAVADGGWLEMGVGWFAGGRESSAEGQGRTIKIATGLIDSEEMVIRQMRKKYEIELQPW